ncbi:MAG: PIN domain-containing protein [Candidatus ainarchaeum sp.]|nr:PIN domain-containing protein [Candidatus ainarchaeum sp.]
MDLIVNTNRIIAALVKNGESRKIILGGRFPLYTIEFGIKETEKYKALIKKKAGINEQEFNLLMHRLLSKIAVKSESEISKESIEKALQIMEKIDKNDVPFIALAIELNKPIWSDDKHFKQQKTIKIFTTKELVAL